jgi:hypothetical protein
MEITYHVEDGYAGKSRPQHVDVPDDEIKEYDSIEEAMEMIQQSVQEDFENRITWAYGDQSKIEAGVSELLKGG